jgi:hypothetical protein
MGADDTDSKLDIAADFSEERPKSRITVVG